MLPNMKPVTDKRNAYALLGVISKAYDRLEAASVKRRNELLGLQRDRTLNDEEEEELDFGLKTVDEKRLLSEYKDHLDSKLWSLRLASRRFIPLDRKRAGLRCSEAVRNKLSKAKIPQKIKG